MELFAVQTEAWDQIHYVEIPNYDLKIGDLVVFQIENGSDIGRIINRANLPDQEMRLPSKTIIRRASPDDLNTLKEKNKEAGDALANCRKMIQNYNLDMKLIDCHFSLDGSRITFGFIADGRVDFRELVKELTRHHQKTIRLQQMGIRDEARLFGDIGQCGRVLCCRRFLRQLTSVTSDYAKIQGLEHRGCERLSGVCGRLKCCLAFESEVYKKLIANLPEIGSKIKTDQGQGVVQSVNILKQTVGVEVAPNKIIEVAIKK
ncbi:MAG: regulatory iron-sulfur-containing complex subunit RicT [Patescibacteria group bacterium]|nr:regulatory iron-sulfur-containing complex subunit RicT [Patescibacteria group bacterium]